MADERHSGIGRFFCNDTVLWFIILFLLLFWGCNGIGCGSGIL